MSSRSAVSATWTLRDPEDPGGVFLVKNRVELRVGQRRQRLAHCALRDGKLTSPSERLGGRLMILSQPLLHVTRDEILQLQPIQGGSRLHLPKEIVREIDGSSHGTIFTLLCELVKRPTGVRPTVGSASIRTPAERSLRLEPPGASHRASA